MESNGYDNIEKATYTCKDIIWWLYLLSKGKGKSIPTIRCSNRNARKKFELIEESLGQRLEMSIQVYNHKSQLTNHLVSLQRPLEIIASSSGSTQDFLSKLTQIQTASQEKSTYLFGKLLNKTQKMLLIASSRGNVIPTELKDKAMAFFVLSNCSQAQQYLESILELDRIKCSIPTIVANLWLQGYLLWLNPLTP